VNSPTKTGEGRKRTAPAHSADDPEQSKRFLEAAKEAGADETEKGAERAFKAVVRARKSQSNT
jgi:hypothetical protein